MSFPIDTMWAPCLRREEEGEERKLSSTEISFRWFSVSPALVFEQHGCFRACFCQRSRYVLSCRCPSATCRERSQIRCENKKKPLLAFSSHSCHPRRFSRITWHPFNLSQSLLVSQSREKERKRPNKFRTVSMVVFWPYSTPDLCFCLLHMHTMSSIIRLHCRWSYWSRRRGAKAIFEGCIQKSRWWGYFKAFCWTNPHFRISIPSYIIITW